MHPRYASILDHQMPQVVRPLITCVFLVIFCQISGAAETAKEPKDVTSGADKFPDDSEGGKGYGFNI